MQMRLLHAIGYVVFYSHENEESIMLFLMEFLWIPNTQKILVFDSDKMFLCVK